MGLVGCGLGDPDHDGLTTAQEGRLGTDPAVADTDGDGLLDGEEGPVGADPLVVDTDGDGYTDRDEVFEGHSPADPADRIYRGGWPYYFPKDALGDGGSGVRVGQRFLELRFVDQFGDPVDLYDFYGDRPVVLDVSAEWCAPCNALGSWLAGEDQPYWDALWPAGPRHVQDGDLHWITVLAEDATGVPGGAELPRRWDAAYPGVGQPILADPDHLSADYVGLQGWPYLILLDPDLTVSADNPPTLGVAEDLVEVLAARFP